MRSYIGDRIRISLILSVFAIPMLALYVAQHYEEWAFAELGQAAVPEYVAFRNVQRQPFMVDANQDYTVSAPRVAAAAGR